MLFAIQEVTIAKAYACRAWWKNRRHSDTVKAVWGIWRPWHCCKI